MSSIAQGIASINQGAAKVAAAVLLRPVRNVNGIFADAVIEEHHTDESEITEHPVEVGSVIADHMYKRPSELMLTYVWATGGQQNTQRDVSFLKTLYTKFLVLKDGATLLQVVTGKRVYQNMVVRSIDVRTDLNSENILELHLGLREIITASTQTVPLTPAAQQALPQLTASPVLQGQQSLQPGTAFNSSAVPPPTK